MAIELSDNTISKLVTQLISRNKQVSQIESQKKLRNAKELLKNYRFLENHVDVELPELDERTNLSKSELTLYSLLGYRARTKEMMIFINEVLQRYEVICNGGGDEQRRRWAVIKRLYLVEPAMTKQQLAELYSVDERTIRMDVSRAVNELSIMLFGVDSLNDISG